MLLSSCASQLCCGFWPYLIIWSKLQHIAYPQNSPPTPTSRNYMQRQTHRHTHILTKQDQQAQHSNKTKRFSFSFEEVEHKTTTDPVNQSGRFRCFNRKLVVWKANCLTDCGLVRSGAHHSRSSRTTELRVGVGSAHCLTLVCHCLPLFAIVDQNLPNIYQIAT